MNKKLFLEWLREQPGSRQFNYGDLKGCLFGSFLHETNPGSKWIVGGVSYARVESIPGTNKFLVLSDETLPEWARTLVHRATCGHLRPVFSVSDVRAVLLDPTTPVSV